MSSKEYIHSVTDISFTTFHPDNNNSLTLCVKSEGDTREYVFFGLDYDKANSLYQGFGGGVTKLEKRVDQLEQCLEKIIHGEIRVTDISMKAKEALEEDPEYTFVPF